QDAALARLLLRRDLRQPRQPGGGLRQAGRGAAPGAFHAQPAGELPDRADLRIRPARILRKRHQGQQPPRRGHRRAISGLGILLMRIAIQHRTHYAYASPAKAVIQLLRLTPRNHDGQSVKRWRIDLNCDGTLKAGEDPFGNVTHTLALGGPISDLEVTVQGEVVTEDRHGIVRGSCERFPVGLYLRETPLTEVDAALKEFAHDVTAEASKDRLEMLHCLLVGIYSTVKFDTTPTNTATPATESFKMKRGVCQDLTHILLACARQD